MIFMVVSFLLIFGHDNFWSIAIKNEKNSKLFFNEPKIDYRDDNAILIDDKRLESTEKSIFLVDTNNNLSFSSSMTGRKIIKKRNIVDERNTNINNNNNRRIDYETAINQTINDYYAQRKAVMDRYYARQREIVEKFRNQENSSSEKSTKMNTKVESTNLTNLNDSNRTENTIQDEKFHFTSENNKNIDNKTNKSSISLIYKSSQFNLRDFGNETDSEMQSESSNNLENAIESRENPGYFKLGEFKKRNDEKIVYQHNLGINLKGSSQLEATFQVIVEGSYVITVVEAFPYANSSANITWIDGGPGKNHVKLNIKGRENQGFSYAIKVWGIPEN